MGYVTSFRVSCERLHDFNGEMEVYAKEIYNRFNEKRKMIDAQKADVEDLRFLENLENEIKNKE